MPSENSTFQKKNPELTNKTQQGSNIVKNYALGATGSGLIPAPILDQVVVTGLIGKMVYDLGQLYEVPTPKYQTKAIIVTILSGLHSRWITYYLASYASLLFPGIGYLATLTIRPLISGAIVYAVGNIFVKQFAKGRNLETFDVDAAKKEFERGFEEGKNFIREQLANNSVTTT